MDLTGIIAISGKPGLYKVVGQGKNSLIVESLIDGKRLPAHSSNKISSLEDITIYTTGEDAPLAVVLRAVYTKSDGGEGPSHKEDVGALRAFLLEVLPELDGERVYNSDIQKLFQWYNLLHKSGELKTRIEEAEKAAAEEAEKATEEAPGANTKKATAKKDDEGGEVKEAEMEEEKPAPKKVPAKKAAAKSPAKSTPSKTAAAKSAGGAKASSKAAAAPKKTGKGKV